MLADLAAGQRFATTKACIDVSAAQDYLGEGYVECLGTRQDTTYVLQRRPGGGIRSVHRSWPHLPANSSQAVLQEAVMSFTAEFGQPRLLCGLDRQIVGLWWLSDSLFATASWRDANAGSYSIEVRLTRTPLPSQACVSP